ncbi:MAG: hypothetical protein RLN81_07470 [Balneolaceae bacterium]
MPQIDQLLKATTQTLLGKLTIEIAKIDSTKILLVSEFAKQLLDQIKLVISSGNYKKECFLVIELDIADNSNKKELFENKLIEHYYTTGKIYKSNLITVGPTGGIVNDAESLLESLEDVVDLSMNNKQFIYFIIDGASLEVFIDGRLIKQIGNIFSPDRAIQFKYHQPIENYRTIVNVHNHKILTAHSGSQHWINKRKRILRSSPEKIFRTSLALYMDDHIANGYVDEEASNNNSDDSCDIIVHHYEKKKDYLFELKWLGKSEGTDIVKEEKVKYQLESGLEQVHIYLERNDGCCNAHLIIYDGREETKEHNFEDKDEWDERIDKNPQFVHLVSKSASELGKESQRKN